MSLFVLTFLFLACNKSDYATDQRQMLIGNWLMTESIFAGNRLLVFNKKDGFNQKSHGLSIENYEDIIEIRADFNDCGVGRLTYTKTIGKYTLIDNVLTTHMKIGNSNWMQSYSVKELTFETLVLNPIN